MRTRRRWRRIAWPIAALAIAAAGAELVCRFGLGLGDPPLYVPDERIEYLPKPGVYSRFGNRVSFNEHHMRSTSLTHDTDERRVLVLGDSVVHGGARLDDDQIATALLEPMLAATSPGPWRVLNISCGSWGPENLLEYVRRFGTFDARIAIVVLNNGDAWDVPTFEPLGRELPTRRPRSALAEAFTRYLPRYLPGRSTLPAEPDPADIERGLKALRDLVRLLREHGLTVVFVLHAERGELESGPGRGTLLIRRVAEELAVPAVETGPVMRRAGVSAVYDGRVHLTAAGQRALAEVLLEAVRAAGGL
jgi:hypothetical protein